MAATWQYLLGGRSTHPVAGHPVRRRTIHLLLGRNDSVEIGERDRPGRCSRCPADWLSAPRNSANGVSSRGNNGLRRDAENSEREPALPRATASFRWGRRQGWGRAL